MPSRYIPRPDGDFSAFSNHYYGAVVKFWNEQGLDPADLTNLKKALDLWNALYPDHVAAQNAAEAARQSKDAARVALEAEIRPVTNFVQTYFKTTDADRAAIGIALRRLGGPRGGAPATRPLVYIDDKARLTHTLRFNDESTPTRRARPRGVIGAEVWVTLTQPNEPPPVGVDPMRFVALATTAPAQTTFDAADAGKTAHYALRWLSTTGQRGPWSEVCAATIAA